MMNTAPRREEKPARQNLDSLYRSIAMPALAAALRYPSDNKNPKYAPAASGEAPHDRDAA